MKDISKANRGKPLEEIIKAANQLYLRDNVAVVNKIPTEFIPIRNAYGQVVNVKVEQKSTVDFIGQSRGTPIAFEAKHTKTNRISFSAVQPHQYDFLNAWMKNHGTAFVVVSFNNLQQFYTIPWKYWQMCYDHWNNPDMKGKKCPYNDGIMTTGKASVSPEELPDCWKIEMGGRYFLNYLHQEYVHDDMCSHLYM